MVGLGVYYLRDKMFRKLFRNKKGHSSNTHIMIGFAILGLLYYLNQHYNWFDFSTLTTLDIVFIIFITWAYSQMPDVDGPATKINRYITIFGIGIIIYAFYTNQKIIGITTAVILGLFRLIEHRTAIHSLGAGLIFSAPLYFIKPIYAIIALIMFLAHIISEGEFSLWSEKDWKLLK